MLARQLVLQDLHDSLELAILRIELQFLAFQLGAFEQARFVGRYLVLQPLDQSLVRACADFGIELLDFLHRLGLV